MDLNFTPFPVLHTERLVLRSINDTDDETLYQLRTDENVMRYIDRAKMQSMAEATELRLKMVAGIEANESVNWAITLKGSQQMIGSIAFWRIVKEHYRAEIGYMMLPGHHGQGLMHEALTEVLRYGFQDMKLHSVEANVNPENAASIGLLEKSHFVEEAYFKENYFYNGRFLDSAIYSLLSPVK